MVQYAECMACGMAGPSAKGIKRMKPILQLDELGGLSSLLEAPEKNPCPNSQVTTGITSSWLYDKGSLDWAHA